jgi:hypothetical protein
VTADAAAGTEDRGLKAPDQLALQGHHGNRHMSPDFVLRKIGDNIFPMSKSGRLSGHTQTRMPTQLP